MRDLVHLIAKNRYPWLGKSDVCRMPGPEAACALPRMTRARPVPHPRRSDA
jgi:hypothetical protein